MMPRTTSDVSSHQHQQLRQSQVVRLMQTRNRAASSVNICMHTKLDPSANIQLPVLQRHLVPLRNASWSTYALSLPEKISFTGCPCLTSRLDLLLEPPLVRKSPCASSTQRTLLPWHGHGNSCRECSASLLLKQFPVWQHQHSKCRCCELSLALKAFLCKCTPEHHCDLPTRLRKSKPLLNVRRQSVQTTQCSTTRSRNLWFLSPLCSLGWT